MRVQVGGGELHPIHEFGRPRGYRLQGAEEVVGEAARGREDADLPSGPQARLQLGFDLLRQDLQPIIDRPVKRVLQKDVVQPTVTFFVRS